MPYKRPMTGKGFFKKHEYVYDEYYDCYICPNNEILNYATTDKNGYKLYKSNHEKCKNCPLRKETIERTFGDCKEQHGLRFTRVRGLKKNEQNATLIFACHNLKKMANWRWKSHPNQAVLANIFKNILCFLQIANKKRYTLFQYITLSTICAHFMGFLYVSRI